MRLVAALLVAMGAVTAMGCGGDDRVAWDGPPRPFPVTGTLPVDGFAEYVDAVDEPWERSVVGLATAYALPLVNDASDVHAEFVTAIPTATRSLRSRSMSSTTRSESSGSSSASM